jgi:hypothetical protein
VANANGTRELVRRFADEVFDEATENLENELREAAPLGATGETRRGVSVVSTGGGDHFAATALSIGKGGDFVEDGTAPHVILPRNAKVLRFLGGSGRISTASPNQRIATQGGGVVFATVVHHPGTPARPWFRPVVERWAEFLQRAAARARVTG